MLDIRRSSQLRAVGEVARGWREEASQWLTKRRFYVSIEGVELCVSADESLKVGPTIFCIQLEERARAKPRGSAEPSMLHLLLPSNLVRTR